jgi:hypothetical protein
MKSAVQNRLFPADGQMEKEARNPVNMLINNEILRIQVLIY